MEFQEGLKKPMYFYIFEGTLKEEAGRKGTAMRSLICKKGRVYFKFDALAHKEYYRGT